MQLKHLHNLCIRYAEEINSNPIFTLANPLISAVTCHRFEWVFMVKRFFLIDNIFPRWPNTVNFRNGPAWRMTFISDICRFLIDLKSKHREQSTEMSLKTFWSKSQIISTSPLIAAKCRQSPIHAFILLSVKWVVKRVLRIVGWNWTCTVSTSQVQIFGIKNVGSAGGNLTKFETIFERN